MNKNIRGVLTSGLLSALLAAGCATGGIDIRVSDFGAEMQRIKAQNKGRELSISGSIKNDDGVPIASYKAYLGSDGKMRGWKYEGTNVTRFEY